MMQVNGANLISGISNTQNINKASANKTVSFSDFMNEALDKVNSLQKESTDATNSFISGETDNIHTVMIAGAKADLALQMTLQVRNKVMDAYNEIMNMQI
jgi:flagellar hook-basal body complex protein FliE